MRDDQIERIRLIEDGKRMEDYFQRMMGCSTVETIATLEVTAQRLRAHLDYRDRVLIADKIENQITLQEKIIRSQEEYYEQFEKDLPQGGGKKIREDHQDREGEDDGSQRVPRASEAPS